MVIDIFRKKEVERKVAYLLVLSHFPVHIPSGMIALDNNVCDNAGEINVDNDCSSIEEGSLAHIPSGVVAPGDYNVGEMW
jgi:hypothetical protein